MANSKKATKPREVPSEWNEVWVDTTFETKNNVYHISNYGRIRSTQKSTGNEKIIKGARCGKQAFLNVIQPDGSRGYCFVSKFVAEHFCDKPSEEHDMVIHLDEDYENNKWINLKWVTKEEWHAFNQQRKSFKEGRKKLKKIYKLNPTKVKLIKRRLQSGKIKKKTIAKQFDVSLRTIWRIAKGERWASVTIDD